MKGSKKPTLSRLYTCYTVLTHSVIGRTPSSSCLLCEIPQKLFIHTLHFLISRLQQPCITRFSDYICLLILEISSPSLHSITHILSLTNPALLFLIPLSIPFTPHIFHKTLFSLTSSFHLSSFRSTRFSVANVPVGSPTFPSAIYSHKTLHS